MLGFSPLLGINLPLLGTGRSSLATPSKFQSTSLSRFPLVPLIQVKPLTLTPQLIRSSKLISTHTQQPEIGWDNWNPLDTSLDLDSFDLNNESDTRAMQGIDDRSERLDSIDDPSLKFFTTIIDESPVQIIDREQEDRLLTNLDDVMVSSSPKKIRSKSTKKSKLEPQRSPDSVKPARDRSERVTPGNDALINIEVVQSSLQKFAEENAIADDPSEFNSDELSQVNSSIIPSILSPSLPLETILIPVNPSDLNTESSKLDPDILQNDPLVPITMESPTPASTALPSVQTETTPSYQLAEDIKSASKLSADNPAIDAHSIQPNIKPAISPISLQPTAIDFSNPNEVDTELREVSSGDFETDLLAISTKIEPSILASNIPQSPEISIPADRLETSPTSLKPQETSILFDRLEIDATPESEVRSSDLVAPVTIPTNISSPTPTPILPSLSQLETPLIDRSEVNTEFTSEVRSGSVQKDPLSISTEIDPHILAPNSSLLPQLNTSSTSSNQLEVNTELSEIDSDNLSLDRSSISTNIHPSDLPVASTPYPQLKETIAPLQQLEIDSESTNIVNVDNLQTDRQLISKDINPEVISSNSSLSLQLEETSILDRQIEIDPGSASEVNSDNLQIDSLSISTDINPAIIPTNLSPSLQLDVIPTISNQLEINTESRDRGLSNSHLDSLSIPPIITSILPPSLQPAESSIPTEERGVDVKVVSESSQDNLPLQIPVTTIINDNSPIDSPADPSIDAKNMSVDIANDSDRQSFTTSGINTTLEVSESAVIQTEKLVSPDNLEEEIATPIPVKGYATGGYVKETDRVDRKSIAASDTVAAMLTPGEFVINAKDAQKNLDLLTHINSGGEPDTSISSQTQTIPTHNPITSIQAQSQDSPIYNSLQRQVDLHQISFLNQSKLDISTNSSTENYQSPINYSSPDLIFRKPQSDRRTNENTIFRTPDEWGNIEELINGGNYESDSSDFNYSGQSSPPQHNSAVTSDRSIASSSLAIATKMFPVRGFADGGEVTPPDISTEIEPIVQTIEAPTSTNEEQSNDSAELEILAREIYHRLRQRLEIERERHGSYSGNLSW
jgi:hypothetical protein